MNTFKNATLTQINFGLEGYERRALLTRFKGSRTWSVRGRHDGTTPYNLELSDGPKTQLTKANALELAEIFVRTGRTYL